MSRKLMRVPLDFSYPLHKVWKGYCNPYYKECPDCKNGYTNARLRLQEIVNLLTLSSSDALDKKNHPFTSHMPYYNVIPSIDFLELTEGLCDRSARGIMGHDAIDRWTATRKIIEAAGLDAETWGICTTCNGEDLDPKIKKEYESWKEYEPPKGEGYQLWETCSEGSPISPVFKTLNELCVYAEDNCTTFGSFKTTKEKWKKMLEEDFVFHKERSNIFM